MVPVNAWYDPTKELKKNEGKKFKYFRYSKSDYPRYAVVFEESTVKIVETMRLPGAGSKKCERMCYVPEDAATGDGGKVVKTL